MNTERLLTGRPRRRSRLEWQIESVRAVLDNLGYTRASAVGALCFADGRGLPLITRLQMHGMLIEAPRRVAELARRPGTFDPADIARLRDHLVVAFPAA